VGVFLFNENFVILLKIKKMTEKRKQEIKNEAKKRLDLWLLNSTFEEMTSGGIYGKFVLSIGLLVRAKKEKWMKKGEFTSFITKEELLSKEHKEIMLELFNLEEEKYFQRLSLNAKKMTEKRKQKIKNEAQKRLDLWLLNSTFEEMTSGGSYARFIMSLGLFGYPLEKEKWMKRGEFTSFITRVEFNSEEYNEIMLELFKSEEAKYLV
jgi:hypothetical protein